MHVILYYFQPFNTVTISPQAPIQHLTETTNHKTPHQQQQPYFYQQQTNRPVNLKHIPKYDPIIKPSPVPKIVLTTKPPAYLSNQPNTLSDILRKLQETNHLPHTLTTDNIDNSIRTLVKILNDLKKSQKVAEIPQQNHQQSIDSQGDDYYDTDPIKDDDDGDSGVEHNSNLLGANTGKPGIDYPALAEIPQTSFNCKDQRYKGFFGDPETNCQVWHYCDLNGGQASFLCPNGTIFSQVSNCYYFDT